MATSIDGFIAKKDGDSDWVSPVDTENFEKAIQENGCIIVGRRTFEQYQGDLYPVKGITNIVVTSDTNKKSNDDNVHFVNGSAEQIISFVKSKGHDKALLIGGGKTNALFLNAGVIDEIVLSVHPLVLGDGIKLFEGEENDLKLEFISSQQLDEGLVQIKYAVKK